MLKLKGKTVDRGLKLNNIIIKSRQSSMKILKLILLNKRSKLSCFNSSCATNGSCNLLLYHCEETMVKRGKKGIDV